MSMSYSFSDPSLALYASYMKEASVGSAIQAVEKIDARFDPQLGHGLPSKTTNPTSSNDDMSHSVCSSASGDWSTPKPFRVPYDVIMNYCLSKVSDAKKMTMAYQVYKTIWMKDPSRFTITADVHQNHLGDPLHFSVEVDVCEGWKHRLHFNGYWKEKFVVCNITAQTIDKFQPLGKQLMTETILELE